MIKVCATGNDFLVIDQLNASDQKISLSKDQIALACHRHDGFGADGLVFLSPHPDLAFAWHFFNSDGGEAEMCGNAARAVSQYFAHTRKQSEFSFLTRIGEIKALVEDPASLSGTVQVTLPKWKDYERKMDSPVGPFSFVNTGVPHAVLTVESLLDLESLRSKALSIKSLPQFQKEGVNVTFKAGSGQPDRIHSVTFERGVENFTLSCGTGALASAICEKDGAGLFDLIVQVPGGMLIVKAKDNQIDLKGEGRIIGTCNLGL
ncbi:diaminopimelate epimerase [bacterium]|nr:diaminopimelate epimerase [bacterium]